MGAPCFRRFSAPKPLSQIQRSTLQVLQELSPRPSFGGCGLGKGDEIIRKSVPKDLAEEVHRVLRLYAERKPDGYKEAEIGHPEPTEAGKRHLQDLGYMEDKMDFGPRVTRMGTNTGREYTLGGLGTGSNSTGCQQSWLLQPSRRQWEESYSTRSTRPQTTFSAPFTHSESQLSGPQWWGSSGRFEPLISMLSTPATSLMRDHLAVA